MPIIQIDDHRPHTSGTGYCLSCKHEWPAVVPSDRHELFECPECHLFKGVFRGAFAPTDDLVVECNCGNQLFNIVPSGYFCPNCGNYLDPE